MDEKDIAVKIVHLKKKYRLGVIGGRTLGGEIQSWFAKKRGKEDPNVQIGRDAVDTNESFWALDDINLVIKKGERLGIIGRNGAGKSTLLKIFSRVTAPTEGKIYVDGRVSSMLEVGTGFHEELTGRENVYLNGAILGMTRAEIDRKIEDIIEFSECRRFIDTPVKRYSSGMTVKLAFAISAFLDSDILVMDEVLAVGDVKFQQKCLGKMSDVSQDEGKTVLYVSHNMETIRQLCDRCIVLDRGKLIYDGEVEEAISIYADIKRGDIASFTDLRKAKRYRSVRLVRPASFVSVEFLGRKENLFKNSETVSVRIIIESELEYKDAKIRFGYNDIYERKAASSFCVDIGDIGQGKNELVLDACFDGLVGGSYRTEMVLFISNDFGSVREIDIIPEAFYFEITEDNKQFEWNTMRWGAVRLKDMSCRSRK